MTFFVDITFYTPKNNLEKELKNKFEKWNHKIIGDTWRDKIKDSIMETFREYKLTGGKIHSPFYDINNCEYPKVIYIKIGASIVMNLLLIEGEV